jgi:pyruvate kinase
VLSGNVSINLPGCIIDLPTLTDQDESDIFDFGLKKGIDIIAASFIRKEQDIENIRDLLGPRGAHIKIIAKIEN